MTYPQALEADVNKGVDSKNYPSSYVPNTSASCLSSNVKNIIKPQRTIPTFAKDGSGYNGDIEEWHAPDISPEQAKELEKSIGKMESFFCSPEKGALLTRVLALLSHYRSEANPPQVERLIAEDWAEDLYDYPMEAIEYAARWWRRNKKFRPAICEIRGLCEDYMEKDKIALERMRLTLLKYKRKASTKKKSALHLVSENSFKRMP